VIVLVLEEDRALSKGEKPIDEIRQRPWICAMKAWPLPSNWAS